MLRQDVQSNKEVFRDLEKGGSKEELAAATNKEIMRSEARLLSLEANMTPVEMEMARLRFDAKLARAQATKLLSGGVGGAKDGSHV